MKSITYNHSHYDTRGWWVMDQPQSTTLMEAVAAVPDPRKARGQRHSWPLVLTLITAALAAGQRSGRAIGQWVQEHQEELRRQLPCRRGPCRACPPCAAPCGPGCRCLGGAPGAVCRASRAAPAPDDRRVAGPSGRWQSRARRQPAWGRGPSGQPGPASHGAWCRAGARARQKQRNHGRPPPARRPRPARHGHDDGCAAERNTRWRARSAASTVTT